MRTHGVHVQHNLLPDSAHYTMHTAAQWIMNELGMGMESPYNPSAQIIENLPPPPPSRRSLSHRHMMLHLYVAARWTVPKIVNGRRACLPLGHTFKCTQMQTQTIVRHGN